MCEFMKDEKTALECIERQYAIESRVRHRIHTCIGCLKFPRLYGG